MSESPWDPEFSESRKKRKSNDSVAENENRKTIQVFGGLEKKKRENRRTQASFVDHSFPFFFSWFDI